jgi:zinc and cadmium transporter
MSSLVLYCLIAFLTTLSGSFLPLIKKDLDVRYVWRLLAFGSGALLSIAFMHLIPESFELSGRSAGVAVLSTFLTLFAAENFTMVHACEDFLHPPRSRITPVSALLALALHAAVDGMAIGVGLRQSQVLGGIVSLGVILHKFSDGLTLTGLLQAAGYSVQKKWTLASLLALATPIGAMVSFLTSQPLPPFGIGIALGIATGSFLYVAAADLLPRLHETHDKASFFFFLIGMVIVGIF